MTRHPLLRNLVLIFVMMVAVAPSRAQTAVPSPASVDFGSVVVGQTKFSVDGFTLFNGGSAPLIITSVVASPSVFAVTSVSTCPSTILPGTGCLLQPTFSPSATGTATGFLTITDNAPGSPHIVTLTGTGVSAAGPVLSLQNTNLHFPNLGVGSTGTLNSLLGVQVSNPGAAALSITNVATSPSVFEVVDSECPSIVVGGVAPGADCSLTVAFNPTAVGTVTGTLTITDNAPGSPHIVTLTGTGESSTGPVASILSNPSSTGLAYTGLSGGGVPVGTTSSPVTGWNNASSVHVPQVVGTVVGADLVNTGSTPLVISSMVTSPEFSVVTNCGTVPPVTGQCLIQPTFTPTAAGNVAGALTITDNAPDSPQVIILSGKAVSPTGAVPSLSATILNDFQVANGVISPPQTVSLTNTGTAPLTIAQISGFTIPPNSFSSPVKFAQTNNCPIFALASPATLGVGASCTIDVTFTGSSETDVGGIFILDNIGEQDVLAIGTATPPPGTQFTVTPSAESASVSAGQPATFNLTVTPYAGFNQTVSFTCTGAPSLATCTVFPPSITLNGTNTATITVTVTTTAHSIAYREQPGSPRGANGKWMLVLATLTLLAAMRRRFRLRLAVTLAPTLTVLVLALLLSACGGGYGGGSGGNPRTPAGTYALTITATSSSAVVSTNLTLTVN